MKRFDKPYNYRTKIKQKLDFIAWSSRAGASSANQQSISLQLSVSFEFWNTSRKFQLRITYSDPSC
ncbi:hypothetical protein ACTXT7_008333 [Hymenolepis weldensis]